jgi:uncharacterized protein (DUF1330 family)
MGAYVLGVIDKRNVARYADYATAGFESLEGFDVEFVAVDALTRLEGSLPASSLIPMKFKNEKEADRVVSV